MLKFTIYGADVVGQSGNCLYPNKFEITDKDSFLKAIQMDHVTAKYKENYRIVFLLTVIMTIQKTRKNGLHLLILHFQYRELFSLHLIADTITFRRVINRQDQDFMCFFPYQRLQMKKSMPP